MAYQAIILCLQKPAFLAHVHELSKLVKCYGSENFYETGSPLVLLTAGIFEAIDVSHSDLA